MPTPSAFSKPLLITRPKVKNKLAEKLVAYNTLLSTLSPHEKTRRAWVQRKQEYLEDFLDEFNKVEGKGYEVYEQYRKEKSEMKVEFNAKIVKELMRKEAEEITAKEMSRSNAGGKNVDHGMKMQK